MIDKEGIYKITMKDYVLDPVIEPSLSRSMIKSLLFNSPAHAWYSNPRLNPDYKEKENGKFDIGTSAHSLLFEGDDNIVVVEADDWRTNKAKTEREEANKEGKTALLEHQFEEVNKMVESAKKQISGCKELGIKDLSKDGDPELTYIWQEDNTWFRIRPDWISKDRKLILDYKTTGQSANPEDISRHIVSMGYDIQEALYKRGINAIDKTTPKFVFMFQENFEPYLCSFISLTPEFQEMATQKVAYGIFLWNQCIESGKWEGYPNRVCHAEPPAWSLAHWELIASRIGE